MTSPPPPVPGDAKDWTWVLTSACPECGFDAATINLADVPSHTRGYTSAWATVLARPNASERPSPEVWSPLEYACHVRDVFRVFDARLRRMLDEDDPWFQNWDQDETAIAERYWEQNPATVAAELTEAGHRIADAFAAVRPEQWERPGRRSDGAAFTVATFAHYFLHDPQHHLHDVGA